MANSSNNPIPHLSTDWEFDPISGKKFSGASVQAFIKRYLGAISKAAYFDPNDYTMYWFATDEDKEAFRADQSKMGLVLYSTQMSFSSELYRIDLVNNNSTTQLNVATNENNVNLSVSFDVQTKAITDAVWRSTGKGAYVTTYIDVGATGEYQILSERQFLPAEDTFSINVRNALDIGVNRVRISFVSEDDSSLMASITYTISLTEMFIEPLNNEWYKPIVEGGDMANYKLGGFRIVGAVNKTLHMDIYSGNQKIIGFEKLIGTSVYDRVPYYYIASEGFDLSSLNTGVYVVSAYVTSGSLVSNPINYNIMYIKASDKNTAQLLCINNVENMAYNYTTAKLFEYCIYNKGSVYGTLSATVRLLNGTATSSTTNVILENITTGESHPFNFPIEWLTEETLDLHVQVTMDYGNEQIATIRLDNSATFPPTYGYDFYINASSRGNTDQNRENIINFVNNEEYTATWENMTWMNNIDGWTDDNTGRPCLLIPARSKMTLPYTDYRILDGENMTIEMCYKVSNVTDYSENVITICDNPTAPNFKGVRIRPCNITVHSSEDSSDANDVKRGTNLIDEKVVHFVLTIYHDFTGHSNRNLVTGYIDGCKNFQFDYQTGAVWQQAANLVIGAEKSDVSLYFIRVYHSVLSDSQVQANYVNSMSTITQREDLQNILKSVMDASLTNVDYKSVKDNNKNFFVIEMANGARVPSKKDNWDKEQKGLSTLEMHFGEHPSWDWKIEGVETAGQGTTSMNYYLWNLRWRIDKTSGKKVNVSYLSARRTSGGSYVYDWSDSDLLGSVNFDGVGNHPPVKRITAKINFASSMQSHKIGATRAYTELHDAIGLQNEAQKYAEQNDLPIPTVSVYQYPVYGFEKRGDTYSFIGLFTIGPDKNDKSTFGLDINNDIKNNLIRMEGTDHSRKMVMFNYPWNTDVQYLASNECLNIVKGANDYDNGWEVSACHGLGTDEPDDQAAINDILAGNSGFKPAYDVAYKNSTLILGIPLNEYGETAADTLNYINTHLATFQARLDDDHRMTYANYQFWIEGEYMLYYYDIKHNRYMSSMSLVEQNGNPEGETVAEQNEWFKQQRRDRFKIESQAYWDIPECIYHYDYNVLIGAMDNFGKNTYPYKMGDKFCWAQDDLDSIFGIGNAGADNMPTWMEFEDSNNGSVYFGGSTSVFWNLIHECFMDDYINATTGAIRPGIISMGKQILNAMSSIAGGTNTYDGIMKYIKQRFWDNAQDYFPQSAYNADAALKYEAAWIDNGQEVDPLSQSLGNHFSAEEYWVRKRMIYMMSFFKAGPFGSYADGSLGQIAFRPQSLQELTVTPSTDLYPAFASGQGMVSTNRTRFGSSNTFIGPFGVDGQTDHRINASNYLLSLGDLKDLQLGAQYIDNLKIEGDKLVEFKIGDEVAENIITPAVYYTAEEIANAQEGDDAYGKTVEDIKVQAVTEPNVTTNVPSITFDGTKCIEKIDARNASSLSGTLDVSGCKRLKEAYLEGSNLTQVVLDNGQRISVLHLPDTITSISLRNLKLLEEFPSPENPANISLLNVENCRVNTFALLNAAYQEEESSLQYVRIVFDDVKEITRDQLIALIGIGSNKDKDGNDKTFNGVTDAGGPSTTSSPLIDGIVSVSNGIYNTDLLSLDIQSEENYGDGLKKALTGLFGAGLYLIYDPSKIGIHFVDSNVEQLCVANWDSDNNGILSAEEAASITGNLGTTFRGNTSITSFDELQYFTSLSGLYGNNNSPYGAFGNCTELKSVTLPPQISSYGQAIFRGCSKLETVTLTRDGAITMGGNMWVDTNVTRVNIYSIDAWMRITWAVGTTFGYNSGTTKHDLYLNGEKITSLSIPNTIGSILNYAFYGCKIQHFTFNGQETSIGNNAFYGCNNWEDDVVIPNTVTSIGNSAFASCSKIKSIVIPNASIGGSGVFSGCTSLVDVDIRKTQNKAVEDIIGANLHFGNGTGTFHFAGNITTSAYADHYFDFQKIVIDGDCKPNFASRVLFGGNYPKIIRIGGDLLHKYTLTSSSNLKFVSVGGTWGTSATIANSVSGYIIHLGYDAYTNNAVPCAPTAINSNLNSKASKIYVGKGESASEDNNILSVYLADSNWSALSSKLDTWYNYINSPDANPDYIN